MSSPLYEKNVARHDYISIDGTDYSNAFRQFGLSSEHSEESLGAFSESGVEEKAPGTTAQGFTGEFYISAAIAPDLWAMHAGRDIVEIQWQPNGLSDNTGPLWYGNCTINQFNPSDTYGSASTSPFSATVADADGIRLNNT